MTSRSFSVVLEPQEGGGFAVLVPALPEVVTEGETEADYRCDRGLPIPDANWFVGELCYVGQSSLWGSNFLK
jgi:hypothetical protein